jgi:hypothetical protein
MIYESIMALVGWIYLFKRLTVSFWKFREIIARIKIQEVEILIPFIH